MLGKTIFCFIGLIHCLKTTSFVTGLVAPISIKKGHFSSTLHHFFRPMPSIELKKWFDWPKTVCFFDPKPLT
jgi:hypothetical protein